jgi:hypothetical protein|tara:strand:- start:1832 stop:2197 length:366 start_codon:yes stop_codon:yes gene_type:complete
MNKMIIAVLTSTLVVLSGCATILNDEDQSINLSTSNGSKISALVGGQQVTTPANIKVKRAKDDLVISTSNEKCSPTTSVASDVDSVFFVNILSGGPFGSTTDYSSEEMWEYDSDIIVNCND